MTPRVEPNLLQQLKCLAEVLCALHLIQSKFEITHKITGEDGSEGTGVMAVRLVAQQVHLQMLKDQMTMFEPLPKRWNS